MKNYNTISLVDFVWKMKTNKEPNVHLTNLRICRISAVCERKREKHRKKINRTQDNEIKC